jgi:hypothetical protein
VAGAVIKAERLFFDLKEVLNLHRFYTSSPNGVAMQVYAAALVHTALRVAQGHIAQASGIEPEEIAPAKFFPRLAAASIGLTWLELAFIERSSVAERYNSFTRAVSV